MDIEDRTKTSPSGGHENHGVHLCHKCGWPFPNPHPSARHRRAHKRVCGTIEGYMLIDSGEHANSTVSDDEHGSDEDQPTPSPKIEKRRTNEIGSGAGGVGARSNRSEEDVFSDTFTEFSDNEEERLEGARVSSSYYKNVERAVMGDHQGTNQQLKVDATAGIVQLPNTPTDSSQMHNAMVLETAINLLGSATPSEDNVMSSYSDLVISSKNRTEELAVGISGVNGSAGDFSPSKSETLSSNSDLLISSKNRTEELAVGISVVNGSAGDFSPSKSETLTDAPKEHVKADIGDHGMQFSTALLEQESDVKRNEESNVDKVLSDFSVTPSKTASEASEVACKSQETNLKISDSATADQIVESKEEQNHELGPTMSLRDLSPEVKCFEHTEALVNSAQIGSDYSHDIDVGSHGDSVESCYTKGAGNVNVHVFSVANDIPVIDHGEIMIEDFKDHKGVKSNLPVTLDFDEVIEPVVDNNRDTVYEENGPSFCPSKSGESIHISSADLHALEDNLTQKDGGERILVAEVPIEGQAKTSELKVSSEDLGSNDVEAPPETTRSGTQEIQTDSHLEGHQSHDFHNDSSQEYLPEPTTMGVSGVIPMAISMNDKVSHSTNLNGGVNADDHEKDKLEKCDTDGKDSWDVDNKEPSTNIKTTSESSDDIFVSKDNQTTNLLGAGNSGEHENAGIKISDLAGNESRDVAVEEKPEMSSEMTLESACRLSEPEIAAEDRIDKVTYNSQETESTTYFVSNSSEVGPDSSHLGIMAPTHLDSQNYLDEDSQEAIKELNVSSEIEVLAQSAGAICKGAKSNHDGDAEIIPKISEIPPEHMPLESEYAVKNSATVEDSHCKDGDLGGSGISTEYLQEEGDEKLTKQPVEVSAVFISVDSQTDSLEGNWGSVSVLSTQSDAPAATDEVSPLTASQAPAQQEKVNLQISGTTTEGHHSNKTDVFEAPSFMTWVERGDGFDQKPASYDIQTAQNTQQPKSEASSQAGWFPSLTNVANESKGRKKNEEIIAKVTNWSAGKQHAPLKSLLVEANLGTKPKSPNPKQTATVIEKHENTTKTNDASATATTVNSLLGPEEPKREAGREWNSTERYPTDKKKEKRKVREKPFWVPFVCCSSVN